MKSNIILIGFMGSGKTTIAKQLAYELDKTFTDFDDIIQHNTNMTISEIFGTKGESFFRLKEDDLAREMSGRSNLVMATGGGIVLAQENMEFLSENGIIIFLKCSFDTVVQRIKTSDTRPLFSPDNLSEFEDLFHSREILYNHFADFTIEVDKKEIRKIVTEIKEKVQNKT